MDADAQRRTRSRSTDWWLAVLLTALPFGVVLAGAAFWLWFAFGGVALLACLLLPLVMAGALATRAPLQAVVFAQLSEVTLLGALVLIAGSYAD